MVMDMDKDRDVAGTDVTFLSAIRGLPGPYGDEFAEVMEEVMRDSRNSTWRETDSIEEDA